MKVINKYVAIEEEVREEFTASGLLKNAWYKEDQKDQFYGIVKGVSNHPQCDGIKVGDRILYERYNGGFWENIDGVECFFTKPEMILCVVEAKKIS